MKCVLNCFTWSSGCSRWVHQQLGYMRDTHCVLRFYAFFIVSLFFNFPHFSSSIQLFSIDKTYLRKLIRWLVFGNCWFRIHHKKRIITPKVPCKAMQYFYSNIHLRIGMNKMRKTHIKCFAGNHQLDEINVPRKTMTFL